MTDTLSATPEPRTEAGRTLRSFACWEFHAFSVNDHNASCGRTLDLILAIEAETDGQVVEKIKTYFSDGVPDWWDAEDVQRHIDIATGARDIEDGER